MSEFRVEELNLKGAYLINDFYVGDNRGGFTKYFEKDLYANAGIEFKVDEMFASVSGKNVIRGLHFQIHKPQAKLVCVVKGRAWDVIVDLRPKSPTYKKWISVELCDKKHNSLYIPQGFAHGFVALEDETIMLYQCDGTYDKKTDTGILYNDPQIGIKWPVNEVEAIHSSRDLKLMSFEEYKKHPMELT